MVSVFLSYDREDAGFARPVAAALEKAGHSVWWDRHIKGGAQYSKEIDKALKAADAVVVLWSERSVESAWVRDEAAAGRDSGRLVPARLDSIEPPLGFRQYQTIDLSKWRGRGKSAQLTSLIEAVETLTPAQSAASVVVPAQAKRVGMDRRYGLIALLALFAIIGAAIFVWQPWTAKSNAAVLAIGSGAEDSGSKALARDLLARLGDIQTAQSASMRLVSGDDPAAPTPELLFQAARVADAGTTGASLVLMGARDRKVLWSRDFQQPSERYSDLTAQIATTAALVLDCAVEGTRSPGATLRLDSLKPYLDACIQMSEAFRVPEFASVIPKLLQVLDDAPRFRAAWQKLLIAQSIVLLSLPPAEKRDAQSLKELSEAIVQARKIDPDMAEATLAEASFLPSRDFAGQMRLFDRALNQSPSNPTVLSFRASALLSVGRTIDGLADRRRAALLDPLSPTVRIQYVFALSTAGMIDSAKRELDEAERLWPGSDGVTEAKFELNARYGDPLELLKTEHADSARGGMRKYLQVKADPTETNVAMLFSFFDDNLARMQVPINGLSWAMPIYGEFHRTADLLQKLLDWKSTEEITYLSQFYFEPQLRALRHDPRFLLVAKRAGLLDYWTSSGKWPDFCFDGDQPYDCKTETARLLT